MTVWSSRLCWASAAKQHPWRHHLDAVRRQANRLVSLSGAPAAVVTESGLPREIQRTAGILSTLSTCTVLLFHLFHLHASIYMESWHFYYFEDFSLWSFVMMIIVMMNCDNHRVTPQLSYDNVKTVKLNMEHSEFNKLQGRIQGAGGVHAPPPLAPPLSASCTVWLSICDLWQW